MPTEPSSRNANRNIRIGKYEVLTHIATGGMGAVYKARDSENGEVVALKVLAPEMAAKPAMVERFRREGRHALRLRHENIVTVFDCGQVNDTLFLAMEYVDGIDLHEYCQRKGMLDLEEARQIVLQAARALQHSSEQGIIHRDIKPANFLITRSGGRLQVKLTDLGLAREQTTDEFRVTRAGTTVGTLDYMAPEQARDSGATDVRSDLYSLGGTWYHMLAGRPPFPQGGLAERLLQIMNTPPPDIRKLNPRVSAATWAVIQRLLAKDPDDRYATPADLIEDLEALAGNAATQARREVLAQTVVEDVSDEAAPPPRSGSGSSARTRVGIRTKASSSHETALQKSARRGKSRAARKRAALWAIFAGTGGFVLVMGLVLLLVLRSHKPRSIELPPENDTSSSDPGPSLVSSAPTVSPVEHTHPVVPVGETKVLPPKGGPQPDPPNSRHGLPALYTPASPFPIPALRKLVEEARHLPPAPGGPPLVLQVSRSPIPGGGPIYSSLREALAATVSDRPCVIEIHDQGPIFETALAVVDRHLTIRAAAGFRPLICWDIARSSTERSVAGASSANRSTKFLHVQGGSLTLERLSLAVRWPDQSSERTALIHSEGGDLLLDHCIFSVAGKPRDGLTVVHQQGGSTPEVHCRISHCYARGAGLSLLDHEAPGGEVLIEHSLVVGGSWPLLQVKAANERATTVRAVRSTFVAGKTFLVLRQASVEDRSPRLRWLGWDLVISRSSKESGSSLLEVAENAGTEKMTWRAVNCLYSGWELLQAGSATIAAEDIAGWQRTWERIDGDVAQSDLWPSDMPRERAELLSSFFRTARSPVSFAASTSPDEPIGCDLEHLPPTRESWLACTFDRFAAIPPALLEDNGPPEIELGQDMHFHGAQVDLDKVRDLGAYLEQIQSRYPLAPRVVLVLNGRGERTSSPIHFKGKHLVLYFTVPAEKKDKPLILSFMERGSGEAVIQVDKGSLDIIGGHLRMTDSAHDSIHGWFIKASGGVRLLRCRLEGPHSHIPLTYRGLVSMAGSGELASSSVTSFVADECVLLSGRAGIVARGLGIRVFLRQTVLVVGNDALDLDPGADFEGRANVQCQIEKSTIAARNAVLHLGRMPEKFFPEDPVIIQSRESAFLSPFVGRGDRPGMLRYENRALAQGVLAWQSDGDFYDNRLQYTAWSSAAKLPEKPEPMQSWVQTWGAAGVTRPVLDVHIHQGFPVDRWPLDLLLPISRALRGHGADVSRLPGFQRPAPEG